MKLKPILRLSFEQFRPLAKSDLNTGKNDEITDGRGMNELRFREMMPSTGGHFDHWRDTAALDQEV
jgi:hypothetical protein